jgi:pimeloyl-ACP methyl ester carboxylesterase
MTATRPVTPATTMFGPLGHHEDGGDVVTSYEDAPTRTVSAGGVDFAYRELGPKTGVPVIFLTHLAAVLDNTENRDKAISLRSYGAQLKAIHRWGEQPPADLSVIRQPVLVANGESDRMVPTRNSVDLAQRLPNADLVVYPDAGHGGIFQFHEQFVGEALEFLHR